MSDRTDSTEGFEEHAAGKQASLLQETWAFLKYYRKWWLTPILIAILLLGLLVVLGGTGAAPFIYTLF
ncbi:MAG TPA: DUF5989 family protein [Thermoanaerobaculia bacterium]|nr:DUF5989 family protein [Thermoanaerobaculia bacterium]